MWKAVIIDDDFQVVRGLRKVIPWEEFDIKFAGEAIDGQAGLTLIKEVNPDIVLTDIYMPVMNGIQMIEELKRQNFAGRFVILSGYSDFEYARTALRLGVDDYLTKPVTVDQIRAVLRCTIDKLEETYLSRLEEGRESSEFYLKGQSKEEELIAILNGWNYSNVMLIAHEMDNRKCMVLVVEVLWNERTRSLSLADWNLFKFAVSNIAAEVLAERWPEAIFVWLLGNHAAILLPSKKGQIEDEIGLVAEHLGNVMSDNMRQYLGLEIRIGLGNIKHRWQDIKASADEAMQMLLEKTQPQEGNNVDDMTEISLEEAFSSVYYNGLAKALKEGQDEEVMRLFRLYLDRKKQEDDENPIVYQMLAAELWTLLHNAMLMADLPGFKNDDEGPTFRELSEMTDPSRIEEWLEAQLRALRRTQVPPIQEKHRKAVQFMIEYVHKHYAEDITLEHLASQLYISKNYLNQLFKKVTGETFTNYVIRVRIEKANALLLDGSYLIYEVSEMVGYQNVPYFSTLFKKHCGVSPSELMKR